MNNISPSAPPLEIDYDVELNDNYYITTIDRMRENNNNDNNDNIIYRRKIVLNILIGIFFVLTITYVIYINKQYIYDGIREINNISSLN
jgi:hypothetical protein